MYPLVNVHTRCSQEKLQSDLQIATGPSGHKMLCLATCGDRCCSCAHPNAAGSAVWIAEWCPRGWINTCPNSTCELDHFTNEEHFVAHMSQDSVWRANNADLLRKYPAPVSYEEDQRKRNEEF